MPTSVNDEIVKKPISSPRRSILQSSKLFVSFQLQKGLEVLNLPPDIQEILQYSRMRSRWLKSLLAKVVKLFSVLDKIVTCAQMGVISLIMRGVLYIKRKRFCRGDRVEMDHHNNAHHH
ncbi:hypothetical protein F2Q69_00028343 [Brassica cretica]|uniref:Uncharacterized protein n=1 Tax=Brassica cretica TaxID=69181 RepID=A0A8S9S9K9_BRACR|nr:hypothetical protein F2Q69_00028343 [Brassica cretica]